THSINTSDYYPIKQRAYRASPKEHEHIKKEIESIKKERIIRSSQSPWSSPVVLVVKKNRKLRFCVDYRKLNNIMKKDTYLLPRIDKMLDFNVMPFGLCNAPATFQRLMEKVLQSVLWKKAIVYIDDINIYSETFEQHIKDLRE
ncbi:1834_t:CDS:2, partial [Racocetra persica]